MPTQRGGWALSARPMSDGVEPDLGPDPDFDAVHPSGRLMFRSARGGYLHSVVFDEGVRFSDTATLAEAVLLAADVSHLKAVMKIRSEINAAGFTPSADLATPADLDRAAATLYGHRL